jgi:hypothetical protein
MGLPVTISFFNSHMPYFCESQKHSVHPIYTAYIAISLLTLLIFGRWHHVDIDYIIDISEIITISILNVK